MEIDQLSCEKMSFFSVKWNTTQQKEKQIVIAFFQKITFLMQGYMR